MLGTFRKAMLQVIIMLTFSTVLSDLNSLIGLIINNPGRQMHLSLFYR